MLDAGFSSLCNSLSHWLLLTGSRCNYVASVFLSHFTHVLHYYVPDWLLIYLLTLCYLPQWSVCQLKQKSLISELRQLARNVRSRGLVSVSSWTRPKPRSDHLRRPRTSLFEHYKCTASVESTCLVNTPIVLGLRTMNLVPHIEFAIG